MKRLVLAGAAALAALGAPAPAMADTAPAAQAQAALRTARLAAALADGYGVQYWGRGFDAASLAAQPHGLLILELTRTGAPDSPDGRERRFTPAEVATIRRGGGRPVLGYLNVSETEAYRDYWPGNPRAAGWYGPLTAAEERLARYWTQAWHDVLMARVDALMATGIDGLFLDDVLHYYTVAMAPGLDWPDGAARDAPDGIAAHARAMMALVDRIAARARQSAPEALVVVNNGVFIGRDAAADGAAAARGAFRTYRQAIDGILVENALGAADHPDTHTALREDFRAQGLPVLSLDFAGGDGAARADLAARARALSYVPYVTDDGAFDRLHPPAVTAR